MQLRIVVSVLSVFGFSLLQHAGASPDEAKLIERIFRNYNNIESATNDSSKPVIVSFHVELTQIIDIEEKSQILYTQLMMTMMWTDYRTRWDHLPEFQQVIKVLVPITKLWSPDVLLYNSANENFDPTFKVNAVLTPMGGVSYMPPGRFASTCSMDITWFPYDEQVCILKFGSWSNAMSRLDLQLLYAEAETGSLTPSGEWQLISMKAVNSTVDYGETGSWRFITYNVHMRRKPLFFVFNLVIPTILISCIGLLIFFVPPEAGEKISLGVTILLSLSVFMMLIAAILPTTSDAIPLLGMYFILEIALCSFSCVVTVLVLNYHHRSSETHDMPNWVKVWINGRLARLLWMSRPNQDKNKADVEEDSPSAKLNLGSSEHNGRLAPALPWKSRQASEESQFCETRDKLSKILGELKKVTEKIAADDEAAEVSLDWSFSAMVIDRLCMWITVVATIIVTAACVFGAPNSFNY